MTIHFRIIKFLFFLSWLGGFPKPRSLILQFWKLCLMFDPRAHCINNKTRSRIQHGAEVLEHVEGAEDEEHQVEGVVVEDGEGGRLVVSNLVLLPQDPGQNNTKHDTYLYIY